MRVIHENSFLEGYIKDLETTKQKIRSLLDSYNIPFVFIGGVARNEYARARTTSDVDILVSSKDRQKMLNLPIGYIKCLTKDSGKRFVLHEPKTEVEVMYSGEKAGNNKGIEFPEPTKIDNGKNVMTLKSLIEFKLCSGLLAKRYKDYGDIQDLIKENKLPKNYAKNFRGDLKELYEQLWENTINNERFEM